MSFFDDIYIFSPTAMVVGEIEQERAAQDVKWGEQNPPNGTDQQFVSTYARRKAQSLTDRHAREGTLTWRDILDEEVQEAFAESDVCKLRTELIQVAAVACAWVEAIDRASA